jgi:lysophospholipase L1-like esterase
MPLAGERTHRENIGRALMVLGGAIAIIAVASDALGIGGRADVGPRQALGAIIGIVILLAGGFVASSKRDTQFRIAYALFVVTFSTVLFTGAELLLRVEANAWPFELEPLRMPYLTPKDEKLGWRMPPGGKNNSLGLRNREIGSKVPGVCRVLFLGDSLLYLGETPSGRTYVEEIEESIGVRYETINAGVPGYTTYQEKEFLETYGYDFQPDVVFLGFVLNDLFQPYLHRPAVDARLALNPGTRLTRFDTEKFPGSLVGWSYGAHELVLGFETLRDRMAGRHTFSFEHQPDVFLAWEEHGWKDTGRLLAEISNDLRAKRIPMYVIAFPLRVQVNKKALAIDREHVLAPQRRLQKILAALGRPMIDAQPVLQESGGTKLFADHLHLNPEGNRVMAEFLSGYLKEEAQSWAAPCKP